MSIIKHREPSSFLLNQFNQIPRKRKVTDLIEVAERCWVHGQSTPFPGKHKFDRTPYMIEIARELSNESDTQEVVVMKSAQGGATAGSSEPLLLACVDGQGKVIAVTANEKLAHAWKEDRLDPMFDSADLSSKFAKENQSTKNGKGDVGLTYLWAGGRIDIKTYAQLSNLRQISYQFVILEEEEEEANVSKKGAKQGEFNKICWARTSAYASKGRKMLRVSTPLIKQTSVIYKAFKAGDQRKYHVPCIHCGCMQHLEWSNLKFKHDENRVVIAESVHYECKDCKGKIYNSDKPKFLQKELCEWIPLNAEKARPKVKSYHFNALIYPLGMTSWEDLAQEFVDAQGNPEALQTFINLKLGEPFEDYAEKPAPELLHALKANYQTGELPPDAVGKPLFATMGCDVQAGNKKPGEPGYKPPRIEGSLYGWGLNDRSYLLGHYVFEGAVDDYTSGAFLALKNKLMSGDLPMKPLKVFIDSGHQTDEVNKFCNRANGIHPIKGYAWINKNEGSRYYKEVKITGHRDHQGGFLRMYELSTNIIKRRLYNNLIKRYDEESKTYPRGYMTIPIDTTNKFLKQLTAEVPVSKIVKGKPQIHWESGGRANEALDCYVYSDIAKELFIEEVSISKGEETSNVEKFWSVYASQVL